MTIRTGIAVCISLLFVLPSCQSFVGTFSAEGNIEAAKMAGPPSEAFNAALQEEYIGVAQMEYDEADYEHADLFARKGMAAGNGERVMPEDPANWMLPADLADEFVTAGRRLLAALDGNGRTKAPSDAARAQAMFDCWIQEQELKNEGHQPADIEACRKGFWDALAAVEIAIAPEPEPEPVAAPAPEPVARDYLVYFDFDKTEIRTDTASILDRVIEAMGELNSNSISLVGHADTMGSAEYNQGLSERRAMSVSDYLTGKGLTGNIATSGKGETDPRVPTPDEVMEQENRRVEIQIN
jgi:OOP family OmpA-OmpF porin